MSQSFLCSETIDVSDSEGVESQAEHGGESLESAGTAMLPSGAGTSKQAYWFITIDNPTDTDREAYDVVVAAGARYVVAVQELAPTTQMIHHHCIVVWPNNRRKRFSEMRRFFPRANMNWFPAAAFGRKEKYILRNPSKPPAEIVFCHGSPPGGAAAGGRAAASAFKEYTALARAGRIQDIPDAIRARHHRFFEAEKRAAQLEDARAAYIAAFPRHELREWQVELLAYLNGPVTDEIYWVYDPSGKGGKSWMASYLEITRKDEVAVLLPGRGADMAQACPIGKKIYIIDVPRCNGEHVAWAFFEQLKNGRVFQSKYESGIAVMAIPHVVVFANDVPPERTNRSGFSEYKIKLVQISEILAPLFNRGDDYDHLQVY